MSPRLPRSTWATGALVLVVIPFTVGDAAAQGTPGLSIHQNVELRFGKLIAGPAAGAVTVTPSGGLRADGGTFSGVALDVAPASFTVAGDPHRVYVVMLPATATLSSGSSEMTIHSFTTGLVGSGILDGSGHQTFTVGATLEVAAGQSPGSYAGTFLIEIHHN